MIYTTFDEYTEGVIGKKFDIYASNLDKTTLFLYKKEAFSKTFLFYQIFYGEYTASRALKIKGE